MNQREVVSILQQQAKIEPGFTGLVWQKLEEQNPDFFKAYYARLRLKDQIVVFNQLAERHYHMLRNNPPNTLQGGQHPQQYGGGQPLQQPAGSDGGVGGTQPGGSVPHQAQQHFISPQQGDGTFALQHQQPQQIVQSPQQQQQPYGGSSAGTGGAGGISDAYGTGAAHDAVQPLRSAAHGEGVLAKDNNFSEFNASSGLSGLSSTPAQHTPTMENDGLMGGLNTFPRNFSLSDLSMDLLHGADGVDHSLHLLSTFQDGGDAASALAMGHGEINLGIKRNFSLSDMNLDL